MSHTETVPALAAYAQQQLELLKRHEPQLVRIITLLAVFPRAHTAPSSDTATQAVLYSQTQPIPEVFTTNELTALLDIARALLDIAVTSKDTNQTLCRAAEALHPLFSQDARTEPIGWDLEEYMQWYFDGSDTSAKAKRRKELLESWNIS